MGTRGTTGFIVNGKQFASYQQFDSYPAGVGSDVLEFARTIAHDQEAFEVARLRAENLIVVDESGKPSPEQAERLAQYTDSHVSTGSDWYATLRKCQGYPALILESGYITDSMSSFQSEEYDWVINFDEREFIGYYGSTVIAAYSIDALPSHEDFVRMADFATEAAYAD